VLARPRPVTRSSTRDQAARDELLPRLLVATPAQTGSRGRGRCTGPGTVLTTRKARERERHQALTRRKVGPREHGGDRLSAHPPHSTVALVHLVVGFGESVRGVARLDSRPSADQELRLLPRSPSAVGAAGPGVEAVKGQNARPLGGRGPGCGHVNG